MNPPTPLTHCRICESEDLETILDLGDQALTGIFPKTQDEPEREDAKDLEYDMLIIANRRIEQLMHALKPFAFGTGSIMLPLSLQSDDERHYTLAKHVKHARKVMSGCKGFKG